MTPTLTTKARRTRDQRKQEFRANLLATLERLLASEPFPDITIDRIVQESGVSRSTLYSYFPDKASLLLEVARDIVETAREAAFSWWRLPGAISRDDLERGLGSIVDLYLAHQRVLGALVDAAGYEPKIREHFAGMQNGSRAGLAQHIAEGQQSGHIRRELLPDETAGWLIWMIERGLHQMIVPATASEASRLLRALTDVVWFSLYDGSAAPAAARNGG